MLKEASFFWHYLLYVSGIYRENPQTVPADNMDLGPVYTITVLQATLDKHVHQVSGCTSCSC